MYLDAFLFQDKVLKVWDITGDSPGFVAERDVKLGALHDVSPCPDAPFVMVMGGDKRDDNLKVWDVRESAPVRARFGQRKLLNPLNTAEFGFATADEAEVKTEDIEMEVGESLGSMSIKEEKSKVSGGAAGKFQKKNNDKKKKNKIKNF